MEVMTVGRVLIRDRDVNSQLSRYYLGCVLDDTGRVRGMTYVTTYGVRARQHVNHIQQRRRFRNRLAGFSPLSRISSVLSNDRAWLSIVSYPPHRIWTPPTTPIHRTRAAGRVRGVVMLAVSVVGQHEGEYVSLKYRSGGGWSPGMQIPGSGTGQKSEVIHKPQVTGDGVVTTPFSNSPHLIGEKLSRSGNDLQLSR